MKSLELLERLVGFPTISLHSNQDLMAFVASTLASAGVQSTVVKSHHGDNLNLFATIGPTDRGGVMLSGHTDVVPVEGQAWATDPFGMVRRDDRLYGRGTADMKGFVACALRAATLAASRDLSTPLHIALSCDEEIGCVGVGALLDHLSGQPSRPIVCIVGEPTSMRLATGHKGKIALRATCRGRAGHSALAPRLLNPIQMASDLIQAVADLQRQAARGGPFDEAYDIPYATLHVGRISGGEALNVVPSHCMLEFEVRSGDTVEGEALVRAVRSRAAAIAEAYRETVAEADIQIEVTNAYPGLDALPEDAAVALVGELIGANTAIKVAFGTEGGLFQERLGVPTVICGPGSMDQGHKADEYVTLDQMARCDRMMDALIDRLASSRNPIQRS